MIDSAYTVTTTIDADDYRLCCERGHGTHSVVASTDALPGVERLPNNPPTLADYTAAANRHEWAAHRPDAT